MTSLETPAKVTQLVDRVFGDRYRVEELIGLGASSAVYTAYDIDDDRWVALKLFDQTVAADDAYVQRLLVAVEEAAALVHPNLAEIFDWGDDGGPYIVSELCEGGSLASLIEADERIGASQALVLALECSRALHYLHDHGVAHLSLTPSNIAFSSDQHVRITDYGLSEVLAQSPSPHGSRDLENVRYASPEQARGRVVPLASDMYSLALVVNEAVSGERPAIAETVVGALMERAEAKAELDPRLEALLPPLERCGRVEPDQRPEADELSIALLAAAETMERPAPLPIAGLVRPADALESPLRIAGGALQVEPDPATVSPIDEGAAAFHDAEVTNTDFDVSALGPLDDAAAFASDDSVPAAVELELVADPVATGALEDLDQAEPVFATQEPAETADGVTLDVPVRSRTHRATPTYEQTDDDSDYGLPLWPLGLLAGLIAAVVAVGAYLAFFAGSEEARIVPDLIGVPFDEVAAQVQDQGWTIERLEGRSEGSVVGSVMTQSPVSGSELASDGTLSVTVSLGNPMVEIPSDIVGLTVDQASSRLSSVGLTLGRATEKRDEALAAGLVIGLNEPTTQRPLGQGVSLLVSSGPEDRFVPPEIIGMTIGDATTVLVGLRLQAVEEPAFSDEIPEGIVLNVIPEIGSQVSADSSVTVIVSAGREPVVMPDIVGLALDEAIDELEGLGLIFVDVAEGTPGEEVIGSLPPIGATVDVGTEVLVYLADSPDEDEDPDAEEDAEE